MQNNTLSRKHRLGLGVVSALGLAAVALTTTGCGAGFGGAASAPISVPGVAMTGKVFGGQQPIAGSTIQLYAASTSGYGAASYSLLNTAVTTDANGNFSITGDYNCPSSSSLVYLTALGGNPGAGTNSASGIMAALGACGNLSASTFVTMNEVTTVASVYALGSFMTGYANVGTSATNVQGLTNAFATVNRLVNVGTGQASQATLPTGAVGPVAGVNTLGNILAACINSAGASSTGCTTLFSKAVSSTGAQPTNTIGAALNIARNPGQNVQALFALNTASAPFQPSLATANDFTLSIKYKPSLSTPSAAAVNATGDLWVTNAGNNTISVISAQTGAPTVYSPLTYLATPSGIAFDQSGNAWISNRSTPAGTANSGQLSAVNASGVGVGSATTTGALSGVAVNGAGQVVVSNSGASSVMVYTPTGTTPGTPASYTTGGVNTPVALAINPY